MAKPLIGITADLVRELPNRDWLYNSHDYFRAVRNAGGIPVLLPFITSKEEAAEVLDRLDGLLLSGGNDVDPQLYGEMPHPQMGAICPERDIAEPFYAQVALERNLPLLGICRGHQVLAVAFGGTLWQDIPAQVPAAMKHAQQAPRWYPSHPVTIRSESHLARLLGTEVRVNTYHHQAVKEAPADWVVSATAPDGIIEAMEHPGSRFAISVQWHPESFTARDYNFDRLFQAFIEASQPA